MMFHISALISQKMLKEQLTINEAAKQLGISVPTLRMLLKKPARIYRKKTLKNIARWLELSVEELLSPKAPQTIVKDPVALAIHTAGPIARAVAWAAVEAEKNAQYTLTRQQLSTKDTDDSRQPHSESAAVSSA